MVAFVLCGLYANAAFWKTMAEVNPLLPKDQRFSWWWWTLGKHVRLWQEHKRLCPDSRWRVYSVLSFLAAIVLMILTLVSVLHQPI